MLVLPELEILKRQPKVPHVARTVAKHAWPNEYGTPITYEVEQSRNSKDWWIHASMHDGFRASNTLHTSIPAKAAEWIIAVESGKICVNDPLAGKSEQQIEREIAETLAKIHAKVYAKKAGR